MRNIANASSGADISCRNVLRVQRYRGQNDLQKQMDISRHKKRHLTFPYMREKIRQPSMEDVGSLNMNTSNNDDINNNKFIFMENASWAIHCASKRSRDMYNTPALRAKNKMYKNNCLRIIQENKDILQMIDEMKMSNKSLQNGCEIEKKSIAENNIDIQKIGITCNVGATCNNYKHIKHYDKHIKNYDIDIELEKNDYWCQETDKVNNANSYGQTNITDDGVESLVTGRMTRTSCHVQESMSDGAIQQPGVPKSQPIRISLCSFSLRNKSHSSEGSNNSPRFNATASQSTADTHSFNKQFHIDRQVSQQIQIHNHSNIPTHTHTHNNTLTHTRKLDSPQNTDGIISHDQKRPLKFAVVLDDERMKKQKVEMSSCSRRSQKAVDAIYTHRGPLFVSNTTQTPPLQVVPLSSCVLDLLERDAELKTSPKAKRKQCPAWKRAEDDFLGMSLLSSDSDDIDFKEFRKERKRQLQGLDSCGTSKNSKNSCRHVDKVVCVNSVDIENNKSESEDSDGQDSTRSDKAVVFGRSNPKLGNSIIRKREAHKPIIYLQLGDDIHTGEPVKIPINKPHTYSVPSPKVIRYTRRKRNEKRMKEMREYLRTHPQEFHKIKLEKKNATGMRKFKLEHDENLQKHWVNKTATDMLMELQKRRDTGRLLEPDYLKAAEQILRVVLPPPSVCKNENIKKYEKNDFKNKLNIQMCKSGNSDKENHDVISKKNIQRSQSAQSTDTRASSRISDVYTHVTDWTNSTSAAVHTHTHTHVPMRTHTCTHINTKTNTQTDTHIHTDKHTHTHTHKHKYIGRRVRGKNRSKRRNQNHENASVGVNECRCCETEKHTHTFYTNMSASSISSPSYDKLPIRPGSNRKEGELRGLRDYMQSKAMSDESGVDGPASRRVSAYKHSQNKDICGGVRCTHTHTHRGGSTCTHKQYDVHTHKQYNYTHVNTHISDSDDVVARQTKYVIMGQADMGVPEERTLTEQQRRRRDSCRLRQQALMRAFDQRAPPEERLFKQDTSDPLHPEREQHIRQLWHRPVENIYLMKGTQQLDLFDQF